MVSKVQIQPILYEDACVSNFPKLVNIQSLEDEDSVGLHPILLNTSSL